MKKQLPRDIFINEIYEAALKNRDIYFFSADLGAQALDQFRANCPDQFIHAGISEQNMMDLAAGLALKGKIVYVYAMIPFLTLRCYEQIKVALASMKLPVQIVGVGAGYGYEDAGPTHYATEDLTCMRALGGIEILSPADNQSVLETAKRSYSEPRLRYIRLERPFLPDVYGPADTSFYRDGVVEIDKGEDICIVSSGYMLKTAREAKKILADSGIDVGIIDMYRLKPIDGNVLKTVLKNYKKVITLEEHFLSGGVGSAILETMVDHGIQKEVKRIGIHDQYHCENGGRAYLHTLSGIDVDSVVKTVRDFAGKLHRDISLA